VLRLVKRWMLTCSVVLLQYKTSQQSLWYVNRGKNKHGWYEMLNKWSDLLSSSYRFINFSRGNKVFLVCVFDIVHSSLLPVLFQVVDGLPSTFKLQHWGTIPLEFSSMFVAVESNKRTITKDSVHKLHTQLDSNRFFNFWVRNFQNEIMRM
jgi:hypothetical protein